MNVAQPFDAVRSAVLRRATPLIGSLYADRARRVFWLGTISVCVSLLTTLGAPVLMLALGPILLGVPHLLADVRYLVVRPRAHQELGLWCASPLLIAVALGEAPAVGFAASVGVVAFTAAPFPRKLAVNTVCIALTAAAHRWPYEMQLGLLHVHNLVALGLWWFWRPRPRSHLFIVALVALGSVLIMTTGETLVGSWWAPRTATSFGDFVEQTAPSLAEPFGVRLVLLFAFLQSVHYALWLRLIPDDDRTRVAPRTFKASLTALEAEVGKPALVVTPLGAIALGAWALFDLGHAREGYLRVAGFHGYLELAMAARWLTKGRLDA